MAGERESTGFIIGAAERILGGSWGGAVRLALSETFPHGLVQKSIVLRCRVLEAPSTAPTTVIAKKVSEHRIRYAPDSPAVPNAAHGFLNDWAALQFLNSLAGDPPFAPQLYGGDCAAGVIVMEDLGTDEGSSIHDRVHGDDPSGAEEALIEYITAVGRLHAATIGRAGAYFRTRDALGLPPEPLPLYHDPWPRARLSASPAGEIQQAIRECRAGFDAIGLQPEPGVDAEIEEITRCVEEAPGPFLAFCQGDQNGVGGCMRTRSGLRFFDFDCGGFRHALLEGMPSRLTWGGMTRVPHHLVERMDQVYQTKLARGCPEAADDARFRRAMVEAGAWWNIFRVVHRLPEALSGDRPRGPASLRQQVLAWMDAFADLSEELGAMRALGRSARSMVIRLRELWPAEVHQIPRFPAFRNDPP